jgi:NitT/TauT family transport system permease protein
VSRPIEIARTIGGWIVSGFIYVHLLATIQEAVIGLALGIAGGVLVGVLFAFSPFLAELYQPLMVVFNAMPRIALAPLFIVWLGIGLASKVAMVVSLVFFIIFFSTYAELRDVDVNLINHVKVMGGNRGDLVRHVLFPSALSWIFASLRACVGFAVIGAILGEYLGADRGIGWIVQYGESLFNANMVLSGLVVLVIFVAVLDGSLGWFERRFSQWKQTSL